MHAPTSTCRSLGGMKSLLVVAILAVPALADTPVIKDGFAWDMMNLKSKCAKVTGALQTKLTGKSYTCAKPDAGSTASGKPAIALCKTAKEDSQFIVFAKEADCKAERDTQVENAGGA